MTATVSPPEQRAFVVWFTGLSGSGKSTLAHAVREELLALGCRVTVLDGDDVRRGLCSDLGFSAADRHENVRRVAEVARLFVESGSIVLTALISPLVEDRRMARSLFAPGTFLEAFCDASLAVCEQRDTKGLYRRARALEIPDFTGVSAPYETPVSPELVVDTVRLSPQESARSVMRSLHERGLLPGAM
jgi:adenylylsulfate kinase